MKNIVRSTKKMKVLAIGPHPDDIEIGCGGTLIRLAKAGHEIYEAVFTRGGAGGKESVRWKEQQCAAKFVKARQVFWLGYEDTRVPVDQKSIDTLDRLLKALKPDLVFANHAEDTHQDHRAVSAIVLSTTRNLQNVLFYEVPTSVDFHPDVFVDVHEELKDKYRLLRLHRSQLNKANVAVHNIIDCARSTAHFRGFQGRVKAAEGFKALRLLLNI